jgi:radical SAM protein with 4Fe4S-binding SPASM domain
MFSRVSILQKTMRAVPWGLQESRDGRHLLVWGDLPHWMVVDGEMLEFMRRLVGTCTLKQAIGNVEGSLRNTARMVADLEKQGVLQAADSTGPSPPVERPYPIENISINITSRCNLQCAFCYARDDGPARGTGEISADDVARLLEDTRPYRSKSCTLVLLGGEPFLVPDRLFQIAALARAARLPTIVSTNGTRIDAALAARCRDAGLQVQVSLDGADAPLHEKARGPGTFAKTLQAIQHLTRAGAYTVISMVCHRGNLPQLEAFFELALRLKVNEARFIPLKQIGAAMTSAFEPVELHRLLSAAYALFRRRPEFLPLLGRDAFSILANTCRYSARRPSCGTGLQTLLLDADGGLYPCLNLNHASFKFGSLRDPGYQFAEIWSNNPKLQVLRQETSLDNPQRPCARCPVRYWCLSGCRGETFALTGQTTPAAVNCADLKRTMVDMMWWLSESPGLVKPASRIC